MVKILFAVALLCGAVFLGPRLADSQGFIHIATDNYIIETSITTAAIVILVCFLILHIVINLINGSVKLPHNTATWFGKRRLQKKQRLENEAYLAFEEGSFSRTLSLLDRCGDRKSLPASCLFLGARAAFQNGDLERCRKFLDLAEKSKDSSDTACHLLRARLNLQLGNTTAALENIDKIRNDSYTEAMKTRLSYECYLKDGKLDKILPLLPALQQHEILNEDALQALTHRCIIAKLQEVSSSDQMKAFMTELKQKDRTPALMAPVISHMVSMGDTKFAAKYAVEVLKNAHSEELLHEIASWDVEMPTVLEELTRQAEANSVGVQTNVLFLKALANLELQANDLTKAEDHINKALAVEKDRDLYLLAADLNTRLDKKDEAAQFFALACKSSAPMKMPE